MTELVGVMLALLMIVGGLLFIGFAVSILPLKCAIFFEPTTLGSYSKELDDKIKEFLLSDDPVVLRTHTAKCGDVVVWIRNFPYAMGDECHLDESGCISRVTLTANRPSRKTIYALTKRIERDTGHDISNWGWWKSL